MACSAIKVALQAMLVTAMLALVAMGLGPRVAPYRTLTVLTGSMSPAIPAGSVIVVTAIAPKDVRVGDVVTYQAPIPDQRVVTHRVVAVEEPGAHPVLVTKGDRNVGVDPWKARVESDQVWRVRFRVPFVGRILVGLRAGWFRLFSTFVVPLLIALLWVRELWKTPSSPQGLPTKVVG